MSSIRRRVARARRAAPGRRWRIAVAGPSVAAAARPRPSRRAAAPAPQTPAPQTPARPAAAGAGTDAQPPPPADGQPIFRAGINFVRVDVIVTDRSGNPVADLTQADFEVAEDGKPQTVETFRLVKIDTTAPGRVRSDG